jgi:hypothetical protein
MSDRDSIDEVMNRFRLASRELFNQYFRVVEPYNGDGWALEQRFLVVQAVLFQQLVCERARLRAVGYGDPQPEILVELRDQIAAVPALINRELTSGYWDYPVTEITRACRLVFVEFFDWDQLGWRDYQYVRVQIERSQASADTVGKHALLESRYVRFVRA